MLIRPCPRRRQLLIALLRRLIEIVRTLLFTRFSYVYLMKKTSMISIRLQSRRSIRGPWSGSELTRIVKQHQEPINHKDRS